jgi:3-(3-hydroxy-phenyl)propionate hydroxylase
MVAHACGCVTASRIAQKHQRERESENANQAFDTVQAQALHNRQILNVTYDAKRQQYYGELRATVDDLDKHRAYLMRSSMIQSLRDLEAVY